MGTLPGRASLLPLHVTSRWLTLTTYLSCAMEILVTVIVIESSWSYFRILHCTGISRTFIGWLCDTDPITLDPMPVNKHEGGNLLGIRQRLAPAQDPKKFGLTQLSGLLTFLDVSCRRPLGLRCSENNNNDSLL